LQTGWPQPCRLRDGLLVGAGNANDGIKAKPNSSTHEFCSVSNAINVGFSLRSFVATMPPPPLRHRGGYMPAEKTIVSLHSKTVEIFATSMRALGTPTANVA
jgi:hypothetical protein